MKLENNLFYPVLLFLLLFFSCSRNDSEEIQDTHSEDNYKTVVLTSTNEVTTVTSSSITFNHSMNNLDIGDVIVSGINPSAPKGFLRRITGFNSDKTIAQTSPASIEDAAKKLYNEGANYQSDFQYTFKAGDSVAKNIIVLPIDKTITTASGLNLKLNGTLITTPSIENKINIIKIGGIPKFASMYFLPQMENNLQVTVSSTLQTSFNQEWNLKKFRGAPVTIMLGELPVVVIPEVEISIGVEGSLSANLQYQYQNQNIIKAGFAYTDQWITPTTNGITTQSENSQASAGVIGNCKVWIKPTFTLAFYDDDFVTCGVNIRPYAKFNASLNSNQVNWDIKGGGTAGAYFKAQIFGHSLADKVWDNLFTTPEWPISNGSYSFVLPQSGLVAYYPFNGNANDLSGNSRNLLAQGATLISDRKNQASSAYQFNGVSNIINGTITPMNLSAFSVSFWQKSSGFTNTFPCFMNLFTTSDMSKQFHINIATGNSNQYYITSNPSSSIMYSGVSPSANQWYHVVVTYQNGTGKFYINGILVKTQSLSLPDLSILNTIYLGQEATGLANQSYFYGAMDDIRIYNRELDSNEIGMLYNE